jgi:hypothetical protein
MTPPCQLTKSPSFIKSAQVVLDLQTSKMKPVLCLILVVGLVLGQDIPGEEAEEDLEVFDIQKELDNIKQASRNANRHAKEQIQMLATIIQMLSEYDASIIYYV